MVDLGQKPWKEIQDLGLEFAPEGVIAPGVAHERRSLMLQSVALEGEREGDLARGGRGRLFCEKGAHDRRGLAGHEQRLFGAAAQCRHSRPIRVLAHESRDPLEADPSEAHCNPFAEAALHRIR